MERSLSRRGWMAAGAGMVGVAAAGGPARVMAAERPPGEPFGYCLNTSTIQGQAVPLMEEIAIAAEAGYDGIEPWIREIDKHVQSGGSLADVGKKARDLGLSIEDAIGFFDWAGDDDARRAKGLEEARRNMEMARAIGCTRIAAPPFGVTDRTDLDLRRVAERYRALAKLGAEFGVTPLVEVWGFSKPLGQLGDAAMVAVGSGVPGAAILPDVYHLRKGGTEVGGLGLLRGSAIGIFHMNDYPDTPIGTLTDGDRVYPGDGIAPLGRILRTLREVGYQGMLSLELFNKTYWKRDAREVARTGLARMRAAVNSAFA
ncbi:sugar phosphate isomerase/epimerase family protein [Tundrisphaera sp. TA3]|uniref:sugar phosphate isomerase/epimerase family protein n=1 Tax=Tundrisphaera sp. TA3 TaxID=3435775 RepID=UPI003EBFD230